MNTDLLMTGLLLMVIGMGTVYVFLSIMIVCMHLVHKIVDIINKYFPEKKEEDKKPLKKENDEAEIAVAICCAIKEMKGGL